MRYWLKIAIFGTPSLFGAPVGSDFVGILQIRSVRSPVGKLEWWVHQSMKKLDGKFRHVDAIHRRNRQTGGRTPRDCSKTALCIALRSKNGVQLLCWKAYHISKFFYGPHKHVGTNKALPPRVVSKSGPAHGLIRSVVIINSMRLLSYY